MTLNSNKNLFRWILIFSSFVIISLILWNTYAFFQKFKAEERAKMRTWAAAQVDIASNIYSQDNSEVDASLNPVTFHVITETILNTPVLVLEGDGTLNRADNIEDRLLKDSVSINNLVAKFSLENEPIPIVVKGQTFQTIYYGNSPILNKLKYYPLFLLLIILLFSAVVYFFYKSSRNAEQNKLWTGMAKETAHQIGTPLSSLVGWTEILKTENVDPDYILEIEKDIGRLKTITERFSKIGSVPILEALDIVALTKESCDYLQARSSKLIDFTFKAPERELLVNLNPQLFSWTIENLVKNAIDAMKGKGAITIEVEEKQQQVLLSISDTGKGIAKSQFKKIFEPGHTTKTRGWGLGLSLAKRIVEDYHQGRIRVLQSELGKGTTFQISLKRYS